MNKPILCCLKIKSATLLIGVLDLIFHMTLLATLFASYSHPNFFDHYYTNSISLVASSSSSCISSSIIFSDQKPSVDYSSPIALPVVEHFPSANQNQNQNQNSNSNTNTNTNSQISAQSSEQLLRFQRNHLDTLPSLTYSQHYSKLNNSNILLPKDKSIVMLITTFSSLITILLIYGLIKKRPSYLMPYFSIKVFQVVMASLTTLGFYSCLPNVRVWIQNHQYFPFKKAILLLDNQTLELFVFSILLASILVKLYTVIIVWYCYRYMITIESFRNLNSINSGCGGIGANSTNSFGDDSNSGFKIDDESLMSQPPKYEEIVKQIEKEKNAPRSSTLTSVQSTVPTTSNLVVRNTNEESLHSDLESSSSSLVPSYSTVIANKSKVINV